MITERKRQILKAKLDRFNATNRAIDYFIMSDMDDQVQGVSNDAAYETMKQRLDYWQEVALKRLTMSNTIIFNRSTE